MPSLLVGALFVEEVSASNYNYTEYTGTLDGADYALRIPDSWNGMLVIFCHGYSHYPIPDVRYGTPFSRQTLTFVNKGFAVAASNYGVGGYCIQEGMRTTHQLTEYIIDNYGVTGKVFLLGRSMGGAIALLLGEKYPEVYSGVLDMFGPKDMKLQYEIKVSSNLTVAVTDIESETDGTPQEKPEAYERISPVYNANISIPVITLHGTADTSVDYSQSVMYQEAVANAGCSSLYRLYPIEGAEHGDPLIEYEVPEYFDELVEWSNQLSPPETEAFPVELVVTISIIAVFVVIAGLVIYFKKIKHKPE